MRLRHLLIGLVCLHSALGQVNEKLLKGMQYRLVGPFRGGRVLAVAGIPGDPQTPSVTSGIRLGSPAATTRGFGPDEFHTVGRYIVEVLRALAQGPADNGAIEARVREQVRDLCVRFPIYPEFGLERMRERQPRSADRSG